jgi:hypothetical protein
VSLWCDNRKDEFAPGFSGLFKFLILKQHGQLLLPLLLLFVELDVCGACGINWRGMQVLLLLLALVSCCEQNVHCTQHLLGKILSKFKFEPMIHLYLKLKMM